MKEKLVDGMTEQEIKAVESVEGVVTDDAARKMGQSRRAYIKELQKVIEAADVVI